ncbi:MAG: FtsW/RodA/SpoVE family cell cycle protein [Armatimonadota bacterium]
MRPEHNHIRKTESDRHANALTIFVLTFVVFVLGTFFIFNSSYSRGPNQEFTEPITQVIGAGVAAAFIVLLYVSRFRLEPTVKRWKPLLVVIVILLLLPLCPGIGVERNGARRWILIYKLMIQPSEIVKLLLIMALAAILQPIKQSRAALGKVVTTNGPLALMLVGAVCGVLVLLQDDLGTAVVVGVVGLILCGIAGVDPKHIWISVGAAAIVFCAAIIEPYRWARIQVWWDPLKHLRDEGMQTAETLMGIGNAGWLGVSLGQGRIKWNIPAANTDFAYATIVEELGIIGAMLFATLIFALAYFCILGAARYAKSRYTMLIGTGVGVWLMMQSGLNMLVVLNVLPTTGFPLPFASSGGTAIFMNIIAIGIALFVVLGDAPDKSKSSTTPKLPSKVPRKGQVSR